MPNLIKKITSTPKGWSTKPKERLSYYLYFCGQNAIYNLVASFLTTYLMLSIGGLVKTAGIMLAVKVWDAVNDAIFGVLFDKVKFKSGKKFVPWLKISLVFIPLTTVMLFAIPNNFSENAKLIWLAVSYILWDTAYTLCDVPIFGIITSMSENIDERNSIISDQQIWAGVGSGAARQPTTSRLSGAGPVRAWKTTSGGSCFASEGQTNVAPTPARTRPTPLARGQTSSAMCGAILAAAKAASTRS